MHMRSSKYQPNSALKTVSHYYPVSDMPRIAEATVTEFWSHTARPASNTLIATSCVHGEGK